MPSEFALDGSVTTLHLVQNGRTKEHLIIGGGDDGSVAFWTLDSLQPCARWIIGTTPLAKVVQLHDDNASPLRGCVLSVFLDGTIAVIVVDGFHFLYLVPGSPAPLQKACLKGESLMLIYTDGRTRLWDVHTKEFWRSMTLDKADELLDQGGWFVSTLETTGCNLTGPALLPSTTGSCQGLDWVSTFSQGLERFLADATNIVKGVGIGLERRKEALPTLHRLRSVLSILLTPTLNEEIDQICRERLGINPLPAFPRFSGHASTSLYDRRQAEHAWSVSPDASAARKLSIIAVLRVVSLFEEMSEPCDIVMAFYVTSLASAVGPSYQAPSLVFLAKRWFEGSNEIRLASRILFDAAVTCLSDEACNELAELWQHHLPCLQPTAEQESLPAALSLFICGHIAAEKYCLLSTNALTDISKSITMYLNNEESKHRVLAIELCSRGFQVWQHHVDAMDMLRALFALATNWSKQAISPQNVGSQARSAVLQIASSNTPLFMTTLSLDILHPRNVEHRKIVMQIFAFLIRKRPLVLHPNLPRLMEAVVKSLDPNVTASRDAVLDTATEILGQVVRTFPTVDFHMASQRLAVGTSEGAIVMYDLKTATRLYVLEGHEKRLAACSFSPDGRRLVTVSLEESVVLVWKVGSSFSSFFNPGAPPRQGHGGSSPFKTLSFNVGDEGNMTVEETLVLVRFEWTAERSVKLNIRQSVLTFST